MKEQRNLVLWKFSHSLVSDQEGQGEKLKSEAQKRWSDQDDQSEKQRSELQTKCHRNFETLASTSDRGPLSAVACVPFRRLS